MDIIQTKLAYKHLKRLETIAQALHTSYENACNGDLTQRQITREKNLENEATQIADLMGLKVYFQTDPRGLPVYLVDKDNLTPANNYSTSGVCIWKT